MLVTQMFCSRKRTPASGRSMVEMLGVLAVIGILTIASLSGINYIKEKNTANQVMKEALTQAAEIKARNKQFVDDGTLEIKYARSAESIYISSRKYTSNAAGKTTLILSASLNTNDETSLITPEICKKLVSSNPVGIFNCIVTNMEQTDCKNIQDKELDCSAPDAHVFFVTDATTTIVGETKIDACKDVTCPDDRVCASGVCVCKPSKYEGPNGTCISCGEPKGICEPTNEQLAMVDVNGCPVLKKMDCDNSDCNLITHECCPEDEKYYEEIEGCCLKGKYAGIQEECCLKDEVVTSDGYCCLEEKYAEKQEKCCGLDEVVSNGYCCPKGQEYNEMAGMCCGDYNTSAECCYALHIKNNPEYYNAQNVESLLNFDPNDSLQKCKCKNEYADENTCVCPWTAAEHFDETTCSCEKGYLPSKIAGTEKWECLPECEKNNSGLFLVIDTSSSMLLGTRDDDMIASLKSLHFPLSGNTALYMDEQTGSGDKNVAISLLPYGSHTQDEFDFWFLQDHSGLHSMSAINTNFTYSLNEISTYCKDNANIVIAWWTDAEIDDIGALFGTMKKNCNLTVFFMTPTGYKPGFITAYLDENQYECLTFQDRTISDKINQAIDLKACVPNGESSQKTNYYAHDSYICNVIANEPLDYRYTKPSVCLPCKDVFFIPKGSVYWPQGTAENRGVCISCDSNLNVSYGKTSLEHCNRCSNRYWSELDEICRLCPAGTQKDQSGTACQGCPSGQFHATYNNICVSCSNGNWWYTDKEQCLNVCENKTWISLSKKCYDCKSVTFSSTKEECNNCSNRFWVSFSKECVPCTYSGAFQNTKKEECDVCPNRYWYEIGNDSGNCTLCPAGTQKDQSGTACQGCPSGQFHATYNNICVNCSNGSWWYTDKEQCNLCSNRYWNDSDRTCRLK